VLNLFGYTGGFSIYAAAGGARATTTVDVAAPAIAAARRNFERNRLSVADARFAAEDAFAFLTRAAAAGERYELVISDPPSFAPSRRALETGLRAYQRLHRLCAAVTAPGGILCAASCSSHIGRSAFLATVRDGAREAGRRAQVREVRGAALDHPVVPQFPEGDYLKFAVIQL
jgi:23S rRNA (cytosine1962-C5)-methyltransferase